MVKHVFFFFFTVAMTICHNRRRDVLKDDLGRLLCVAGSRDFQSHKISWFVIGCASVARGTIRSNEMIHVITINTPPRTGEVVLDSKVGHARWEIISCVERSPDAWSPSQSEMRGPLGRARHKMTSNLA